MFVYDLVARYKTSKQSDGLKRQVLDARFMLVYTLVMMLLKNRRANVGEEATADYQRCVR